MEISLAPKTGRTCQTVRPNQTRRLGGKQAVRINQRRRRRHGRSTDGCFTTMEKKWKQIIKRRSRASEPYTVLVRLCIITYGLCVSISVSVYYYNNLYSCAVGVEIVRLSFISENLAPAAGTLTDCRRQSRRTSVCAGPVRFCSFNFNGDRRGRVNAPEYVSFGSVEIPSVFRDVRIVRSDRAREYFVVPYE